MKRFIFKLFLLLLPLLVLNFSLISKGFLFHDKNQYLINKLANYEPDPKELSFLFVGTSRTDCGISPDDFEAPFKSLGINATAINLGLDGDIAYTGLQLAKENLDKYDYVFIEIFPGDPLKSEKYNLKKTSFFEYVDSFMLFHLKQNCVLHRLYPIYKVYTAKSSIYRSLCHNNGFHEMSNNDASFEINNLKIKWENWSKNRIESDQSISQYISYIHFIQGLVSNSDTKLVFYRMPVDGNVKLTEDEWVKKNNIIELLGRSFKNSLIITQDNFPNLKYYLTFEDSHLNGTTARDFSYELGSMIIDKDFKNYYN